MSLTPRVLVFVGVFERVSQRGCIDGTRVPSKIVLVQRENLQLSDIFRVDRLAYDEDGGGQVDDPGIEDVGPGFPKSPPRSALPQRQLN